MSGRGGCQERRGKQSFMTITNRVSKFKFKVTFILVQFIETTNTHYYLNNLIFVPDHHKEAFLAADACLLPSLLLPLLLEEK
jgi:hypothetical protein